MHNYLQRTYIYIYICFPAKIRVSQLGSSNRVDENQPQDRTVFFVSRCICGIYNFLSENLLSPIYIYIYIHINIMCICIYIYGDGSKPCTSGEYQNGNLHLKIYGIIHRFYHVLSHPMPSACSHEPARTGHRWPANFKRSACCGSTAWATSSDGFRALYKVRPSGDVNVGL